jgi:signal transduction histidine kinase
MPLRTALDPRRSLVAGTIWMIVGLAAAFSISASIWVGGLARQIVSQQHVRRLGLEAHALAETVARAVDARQGAIALGADSLADDEDAPALDRDLARMFARLARTDPGEEWLGIANLSGRLVAERADFPRAEPIANQNWFRSGRNGLWLGVIDSGRKAPASVTAAPVAFADLAAPVRNAAGVVVGVIAARLTVPTNPGDPLAVEQALLLDREGRVVAGPSRLLGTRWPGAALDPTPAADRSRLETLANGERVLVMRVPVRLNDRDGSGPWVIQLGESRQRVYERADDLATRIVWVSVCLGGITALVGALGARRLTRRLKRLTRSVSTLGPDTDTALEVPKGEDEVAQLGTAFAGLLADLRRERHELRALGSELERRVAVRSREVERLAEESRYAAVVRERLKIARDLHDTLAHSMMAMLSEIRLLRRFAAHDPSSLGEELARAEQVALDGLHEARDAITQMRVNKVRDMGLGAALSQALEALCDQTGLAFDFENDAEAARLGDERADMAYRMAEEALRNVARHAQASRVRVSLRVVEGNRCVLRIEDDGVGFDPEAHHEGHYGLLGLKEQAQLMEAELRIDSSADRGTAITIAWTTGPETL